MKGVTIVVRHVKDFNKGQTDTKKEFGTRYIWDQCNGNPGRSINLWTDKFTGITTCPDGYRQARRYKEKLPQILKDKGWSEIRHIHVHDPQPFGTTCNPFESVFPLIRSDINLSEFTSKASNRISPEKPTNNASPSTITDVNLYPLSGNDYGGLKDRMTPDLVNVIKSINPDKPREHSTLFCGTRDTLWGPKPACDDEDEEDEKAKKKDAEIQKGTLLYELAKQYGFDEGEITNRITEKPEKGNSVYIFHGKGKLSYINLDKGYTIDM